MPSIGIKICDIVLSLKEDIHQTGYYDHKDVSIKPIDAIIKASCVGKFHLFWSVATLLE